MNRPRFPDPASSRAVLIGVSHYESAGLPPLPAVRANLADLRAALTDPSGGTVTGDGCRVLGDDATPADVGMALAESRRQAGDLLLVYYAGHGILDDDGRLHLALRTTSGDHPGWTAIPIELIKRELGRARARTRVLLLDCCFSGQAVEAMADPAGLASGQLRLTGTFTLTSTTANDPSSAPLGSRHTAFTGALLSALANPEPLTLDGIHRHTEETLIGLGLPSPQCRSVNTAGELALVRGPVPRRVTEAAPGVGTRRDRPGSTAKPAGPSQPDPSPKSHPETAPSSAAATKSAPHPRRPEHGPDSAAPPIPAPSPATQPRKQAASSPASRPETAPGSAPATEASPGSATPNSRPAAAPSPAPATKASPSSATPNPRSAAAPSPAPATEATPNPATPPKKQPGPTPSSQPKPAAVSSSFALESRGRPAWRKEVLAFPASVAAAILSWISFTDPFRNADPGFFDIVPAFLFGLLFAAGAVVGVAFGIVSLRAASPGWTWTGLEVRQAGLVLLGPGYQRTVAWRQIERLAVVRGTTVVVTFRPNAVPAGIKTTKNRVTLGRCKQWPALAAAARRLAPQSVAVER
ncbi:caspase family protein [Amycolatopsis sp. NEAU-NG30]|uniref:Caspase family protein n=1 Tax=Amycolatopsis melonis TaxID=3156488 RepID=A0ABV0LSZ8_9PSEU